MTFIRYFAATDASPESELGEAALGWVPFLLALDLPVRVAAARVADPAGWLQPTPRSKRNSVATSAAILDAADPNLSAEVRAQAGRVLVEEARHHPVTTWAKHADLLITPMEGDFVNVVCTLPEDWGRLHTPKAHNVLLCPFTCPVENPKLVAAACKYDVIVVSTAADAELWRKAGADPRYTLSVLQPTADRLEDFRALLGLV